MTFDIELIETYGMKTALRALRRPMNKEPKYNDAPDEKDLHLMEVLVKRGDDHAKFARMIGVGLTIRAPRYWWQEMATYRLGVETVSESTMHRKMSEPFTHEEFEEGSYHNEFSKDLNELNEVREYYEASELELWRLKQEIPESFLQTRDLVINYQALRHIYFARKNHKLPHWQKFAEFIENEIPYSREIICCGS